MAAAKRKKKKKTGASSGHITNLKQSILETFNIYGRRFLKHLALKNGALQKQHPWPTFI
jgi:hypothetical protein